MSLVNNFGGGGFSPDSIPGLTLDFDAGDPSSIIVETGVSSWTSKKGQVVLQPNASQQPAYDGSKITFDGTDDTLNSIVQTTTLNHAGYTVLILFHRLTKQYQVLLKYFQGSSDNGLYIGPTNVDGTEYIHRQPFSGGSPRDYINTGALTGMGDPIVLVATHDNTTHKIRFQEDQSTSISSTATQFLGGANFRIGSNTFSSFFFHGHIYRVLAYDRVITEDEIQLLFTFLDDLK